MKRIREPIKKIRGMRFRYQFGLILVIGVFALLFVSQLEQEQLTITPAGTNYPSFEWRKPDFPLPVQTGGTWKVISISCDLRIYDKDGDLFAVNSHWTHKEGNVERLYMSTAWAEPDIPNWQSVSSSGQAEQIFVFTMKFQGIRTFPDHTDEYWWLHIEAVDADGWTIRTAVQINLDWSGETVSPAGEWEASFDPLSILTGCVFIAIIYRKVKKK